MKGLRTQEGSKFEKFFSIVQEEAKKLGGVYFLDNGEGRDTTLKDMEVCDIGGWLVPFDKADEFEKLYLEYKDDILWDDDEWIAMYMFADYILDGDNVRVKFDKYEINQ